MHFKNTRACHKLYQLPKGPPIPREAAAEFSKRFRLHLLPPRWWACCRLASYHKLHRRQSLDPLSHRTPLLHLLRSFPRSSHRHLRLCSTRRPPGRSCRQAPHHREQNRLLVTVSLRLRHRRRPRAPLPPPAPSLLHLSFPLPLRRNRSRCRRPRLRAQFRIWSSGRTRSQASPRSSRSRCLSGPLPLLRCNRRLPGPQPERRRHRRDRSRPCRARAQRPARAPPEVPAAVAGVRRSSATIAVPFWIPSNSTRQLFRRAHISPFRLQSLDVSLPNFR